MIKNAADIPSIDPKSEPKNVEIKFAKVAISTYTPLFSAKSFISMFAH